MGSGHTKISPSGLSRLFHGEQKEGGKGWNLILRCPGSVQLSEGAPEQGSSKFADEGTLAHDIGACCLARRLDPNHFLGKTGYVNAKGGVWYDEDNGTHQYVKVIDDEMLDAVRVYVELIRDIRESLVNPAMKIEHRFKMGYWARGMEGTADCVLLESFGRAYVIDYKHGAGVAVDVENNSQGLAYTLGALGHDNPHGIEEVTVIIVQPRAFHSDGPIRTMTLSIDQLYAWGEEVLRPGYAAALDPNPIVQPGPWCSKWCKAILICPETRKQILESAKVMFSPDTIIPAEPKKKLTSPNRLTGEQLDRLLEFTDVFEPWIKAVRKEASDRLLNGATDSPSKFKIVEGKLSDKKWTSEEEVVKTISEVYDDLHEPAKLKSPAQMEKGMKLFGFKPKEIKDIMAPVLAERTPGKPRLVSIDHKAPALPTNVETMFPIETEGEE